MEDIFKWLRRILLVLLLALPQVSWATLSVSYMKGGVTLFEHSVPAYSCGMGNRYRLGAFNALDVSWLAAWTAQEKRGFYASPRIALLAYLNPTRNSSFYGGVATSWAYSIDLRQSRTWQIGMQVEGCIGVEIGCHTPGRIFIEISRVLPALRILGRDLRSSHWAFTSVTVGCGF